MAASQSAPPTLPDIPNPKVVVEAPEIGKFGGTYIVSSISDPRTFNPIVAQETSSTGVTGAIFEGLVEQNYLTGEIEPGLAESWTTSPDGRTWTFTLRQGVRWTDGTPLTMDDVLFSLEVVISAGHVYVHLPLSTFRELTGAEAASFPDMARLFDPKTGLPAIIPGGASPKFVSTDQVAGVSANQISTSYTPEQVRSLLAELNSSGPVSARVWVDTGDHLIRKAVLDGAFGDGGKEAAVQVDISGFNATVVIASPTP